MATDQYAVGYVYTDGQLLAEELSVDMEFDPANQVIVTQYKGFAGISPGAGRARATVSNAIPRVGMEYNAVKTAKAHSAVEFVVFAGAEKFSSTGFIMNVKMKFGADQPSTMDFDFEGEPWTVA